MLITSPAPRRTMEAGWQDSLQTGDIIAFRWPMTDPGPAPSRGPRPALVLEVITTEGLRHAVIAYGTTSSNRYFRGNEIHLDDEAASIAGLRKPTKFVGSRRMTIALTDRRIASHPDLGTPVFGRLPAEHLEALQRIRRKIRRRPDSGGSSTAGARARKRLVQPGDVVVEYRHPRRAGTGR